MDKAIKEIIKKYTISRCNNRGYFIKCVRD